MKKILAVLFGVLMCSSTAFAVQFTIGDTELQEINSKLSTEYAKFPILEKYCWYFENLDKEDVVLATEEEEEKVDAELADLGCGRYNSIARGVMNVINRKTLQFNKVHGDNIERIMSNDGFESIYDLFEYDYMQSSLFLKNNLSAAVAARTRLMKQRVVTEVRDFQTAMTQMSWYTLHILNPYNRKAYYQEVINHLEEDYQQETTTNSDTSNGTCKVWYYEPYTFEKYYENLGRQIPADNTIVKYQIQWFNGNRSETYVVWVNDDDPAYPTIRRAWAYFTDHNFRIVECK